MTYQQEIETAWRQGTALSLAPEKYENHDTRIMRRVQQLLKSDHQAALKLAKAEVQDAELLKKIERLVSRSEQNPYNAGMVNLMSVAAGTLLKEIPSRDDVLQKIFSEELVGFGYSLPRKPNDVPAQIPLDLWENKIDWTNCTVEGAGLAFASVRLVETDYVPIESITPPQPPKTNTVASNPIQAAKSGRKSRKTEILSAFHALEQTGHVTKDTPTALLSHEVREFIFKDVPPQERRETGLSDETIRRIIRAVK